MKTNKDLQLAMRMGELLLKNGAETMRVEDTMNRIMTANDPCATADTFVTPSGIFATINDKDDVSHTLIRRVKGVTTNLTIITEINNISRNYVNKTIDYEKALVMLDELDTREIYSILYKCLASGLSALSFSYMMGKMFEDLAGAFVVGVISHYALYTLFEKITKSTFLQVLLTSTVIGASASLLCELNLISSVESVIIGGIMPLVPGIEMINAVRDVVEGDFLSATTRFLDAFLVGISIAVGVGFALSTWINFFGGVL